MKMFASKILNKSLVNATRNNFAGMIKHLEVNGVGNKDGTTVTQSHNGQVTHIANAVEMQLGVLIACENSMTFAIAGKKKFDVKEMHYKNVKSALNIGNIFAGVKPIKLDPISFEVEVKGGITAEEVQILKAEVESSCPIHQMLHNAGVDISITWKKAD